jgi:hypothetical protein
MTGDAAPNRANWDVWAAAHGQDATTVRVWSVQRIR